MIFIRLCAAKLGASLIAQLVKNLPAMQEILVWSLGWENPLDKGMATHFSILAGEFPQTEELVRLKSSTVQLLSCVQHFAALWTATGQSSQCITKSWNLLNSCPSSWGWYLTVLSSVILFSSCLRSFQAQGSFLRNQLFASGGLGLGSFSFSISLPNEYSGLIAFRMDWFDLLSQSNIVLGHGQQDLALGSMLRRVPYTMRSRRMCLVEIALGSSGQCRQSPEPRVLPFVGQPLVWFKVCSGPRELNLCCSSHCIFRTKGNYLWTSRVCGLCFLWSWRGHCFRGPGGLELQKVEVKEKANWLVTPFLPESMNARFTYNQVAFPTDTACPYSCLSSWFQRYRIVTRNTMRHYKICIILKSIIHMIATHTHF